MTGWAPGHNYSCSQQKSDMDFPGKILLLGEYGILLDSMALSVPYPRYSGRFRFPDDEAGKKTENETASGTELKRMLAYLSSHREKFSYLDLKRFETELGLGLWFESTIPQGAGLGSSGALTAALYARYALEGSVEGYLATRERLAAIESCFHGRSSGIDPLTSLLGQPLLSQAKSPFLQTVDLSPFLNAYTLFLVDTQQKSSTGGLVAHFMECCKDPAYRQTMEQVYLPLLEETVNALLSGDFDSLDPALKRMEQFQLTNFEKMIPPSMRTVFAEGADRDHCIFKLCGSGGGGYLLAISRNRSLTEKYLMSRHLNYSVVQPAGRLTNQLFT